MYLNIKPVAFFFQFLMMIDELRKQFNIGIFLNPYLNEILLNNNMIDNHVFRVL